MRKEELWKVFDLFRIVALVLVTLSGMAMEVLDLNRYYADRLIISNGRNGSGMAFSVSAQSKEEAIAKFSAVSSNCTFLDPNDVSENTCDHVDTDYCEHNRNLGENSTWRSYAFQQDTCDCFVDSCDEGAVNGSETVLYPGCLCDKSEQQCDFNNVCHYWTQNTTDVNLTFKKYLTKNNNNLFNSFIQAGHPTETFSRKTASMISSVFKQSGFECTLRFMHHFTPQSSSSKIVVRAHLLNGEQRVLYQFVKDYEKAFWKNAAVLIGSFAQPFRISVDCETGSARKRKSKQKSPFACSLANLNFENCEDIRNPVEKCSGGDQFMCSVPWNTKCLQNVQCDLNMDCDDGSDEADCEDMPIGSMCDFNNPPEFCEGWHQITRMSGNQESQFEPTTQAPLNKLDNKLFYLLRIRAPSSKIGISREARKGSGKMLSYESAEVRELSRRTSILVSPPFPRTNPETYNPKSKYFQTCKLRFYVCSRTYLTTWHISIISKANNPFDSGRTILYDPPRGYSDNSMLTSSCEWKKVELNIPRQNDGYRLGVFVEHGFDQGDFFGIDDLSFSPTCFEKDVNQSTWEIPDLLISSCGGSGFEGPTDCDKHRALDGQTGHFVKDDGSQEWTVHHTGFYRIEACGAGGGATEYTIGERGECLTLQVHLLENIALRMLIGQMGETGCILESDEGNEIELKFSSCSRYSPQKREGRESGAGGGGATLLTVEPGMWNVVVGGGAGASWDDGDAAAGYGAYVVKGVVDPHCGDVCQQVSHMGFIMERNDNVCPDHQDNQTTVFGGFGGGGKSCGLLGGSGAGFMAGNPFGIGRERSGSSNVTGNFSKEVFYYQAEKVDEGFIRISFCRKQCTAPFVCRFGNDKLDEEYCGCPDGSNKSETCDCPLDCPFASSCQYRNFTYEPFCMCNNGKYIEDFSVDFCEESQGWVWYNYLFFFLFLLVITGAVVVAFHYRNRTEQMKQEIIDMKQLTSNIYLYDDIYFGRQTRDKALERLPALVREDVVTGRVLGKGNFGEVLYGMIDGESVAVKTISKPFSTSSSAQSDFCNEALCMGTFVHENIVRLIGISFDQVPYFIVIEYMEGGDLLSFVKDSRPNQVSLNPFQLTMSDLIGFSRDIAAGCRCLEDYGYVHRDIAARNILLTSRGPKRVAKIADFGMAKEITYGSEYYRLHGRAMLPIKWTPPEAFIDGVFTTKSDIWSFGILCWEVFSLGVVPYPNRRNEEVMLMLTEGARLEYPYGIPTRVYQLMRDCWKTLPSERPTFIEVVDNLEEILRDPCSVGMPFPIHPTVRASYAHAQSTPVSVETPMTAMTDVSMSSAFTDSSTVKMNTQQDVQDRIQLHELMLTREHPYTSDMAACVIDNLRKDLARAQFETGMTMVPQPEYLSPESIDESMQLIPNGNIVIEQTPPTSLVDLNRLAVQNTGPTLHRPDSLNFNDHYSTVPLLECQTR